jgi:DnaK suppressor protein
VINRDNYRKRLAKYLSLRHYIPNEYETVLNMTTADIAKLAIVLRQKQVELSGSRRDRDDIVIEKVSDELDGVQMMSERELAIRALDRNSHELRQIRFALARITDGTYGVCPYCEENIAAKRIAALPWAHCCIRCQEKIDSHEIEDNGSGESQAFTDFANA